MLVALYRAMVPDLLVSGLSPDSSGDHPFTSLRNIQARYRHARMPGHSADGAPSQVSTALPGVQSPPALRRSGGLFVPCRCLPLRAAWRLLQAGITVCRGSTLIVLRGQLGAHTFDFHFHRDILLFLAGKVVAGQAQPGADAFGSQQVRVFQLVFGAKEAAGFDVAFFEQRLEQVIGLAQTGAKPFSKLPLADLWLLLDDSEDAQVHLLGRGHGFLFNK